MQNLASVFTWECMLLHICNSQRVGVYIEALNKELQTPSVHVKWKELLKVSASVRRN